MQAKVKPDWAGEDILSRVVNLLIHTKPIYALMKRQARQVLIKTAEKKGIPWRETCQQLEQSDIKDALASVTDSTVTYPSYYQQPFHAYADGNLCWLAAFEAESATHAMALRIWPQEDLTWQSAQARLRTTFHQVLADHGPQTVHHCLDMGCSVGMSTLALHQFYDQRTDGPVHTVGLDLSPYMLTVANHRDEDGVIDWVHGNAEATGFAADSFDLVTLQFVIHELPRSASQAVFTEARRILRPGGSLAIVDNNPQSQVIQNLPPVLFTLMKSTEPWSDDYYTFDVEAALSAVGFEAPVTVASDPRHRTIIARKAS